MSQAPDSPYHCPAVSRALSFPSPPVPWLGTPSHPALHSPRPDCLPAPFGSPTARGGSGRPGGRDKEHMKFPTLPHPIRKQAERETGREGEDLLQIQSTCGSRLHSGPICGSAVQSRTLRSQHSPENAARERSRVRNLRQAFHSLQAALPSVPPDTKLSKLDVLVLATNYIAYLTETLDQGELVAEHALSSRSGGYLHPVKKWPMRSLLYCGSMGELLSGGISANQTPPPGRNGTHPLTAAAEADKE
nr:PREDICTED: transcription factor 24-like [Paralichthys olivaceus]